MGFRIIADSADVRPLSSRSVEVDLDASIREIIDAIGEDELLDEIGFDAASEHFDWGHEED